MLRLSCLLIGLTLLHPPAPTSAADPWPEFRGPAGNGLALDQNPPVTFSEQENVAWKTELPGRAWSSPVIADDRIWLTTAIERVPTEEERDALLRQTANRENQFSSLAIAKWVELKLLVVDLASGELLATIDLTTVQEPDAIHAQNSYASPTPVVDENRIYCHFGTFGTFCLDRASQKLLWQRVLPLRHAVGPGSSPIVDADRLVLIQDGMERQYVTALDTATGNTVWETDRPEMDAPPDGDQKKAYCTPVRITDQTGREQLICMSSQWLVSYEPETGSELWRLYHGKGFSVVPRPVYADGVVFVATGFGKPQLWAVRVDGSGDVTETHVEWQIRQGIPSKSSPLLYEGRIYLIDDNGVASCIDAGNGEVVWKQRVGGSYSSSPVLAGGAIYFASHEGKVTVIEPGDEYKPIAENQLDGQIMASPAVVNDAMIWRTDTALYRIESP